MVSTPSIFFCLPEEARARSRVLDYDRQWEADPGFVFYDFTEPEALPSDCVGAFDFVLVDPPFITREVWEKYAVTTRLLLREGGRVLCTTIGENAAMMQELLGLRPVVFRPSIPNLVYQYSVYVNFESARLECLNPEIDDGDWRAAAAAAASPAAEEVPVRVEQALPAGGWGNWQEAAAAGADAGQPAEAVSPQVALLQALCERLRRLKRRAEDLSLPLRMELQKREAGGEVAAKLAAKKSKAALDAAGADAAELAAWLRAPLRLGELAEALGERPEDFLREEDRFAAAALARLVEQARDGGLADAAAWQDFAAGVKREGARLNRLHGSVLARVKELKAAVAQ